MRQDIIIDKKLCYRVYAERKIFRGLLEQLIMYTFGRILMQLGILLGHFVCKKAQHVERLSPHSYHFPSQGLMPGHI